MKKIIDWFRDLFYNLTDYALIIGVVAAIALVLVWRLNILFNLKVDKENIANTNNTQVVQGQSSVNSDGKNNKDDNKDGDGNSDSSDKDKDKDDNANDGNQENSNNDGKEISFTIPAGTFPAKIADILLQNKLIDNTTYFLQRSAELKLDTKLKAGDYKIKAGTSVDDILKELTK